MKKSRLLISAVLASVALNTCAFAETSKIILPGDIEISGTPTEARFAETEDQIWTENLFDTQAADGLNYFAVPVGESASGVAGHNMETDGDTLKMEMTDGVATEYAVNPEISENFPDQIEMVKCKELYERVMWKETSDEAVWYAMNDGAKGGEAQFSIESGVGTKVCTWNGAHAFLGCEITPANGKDFQGFKTAYSYLFVQNLNAAEDSKYVEMRYFVDETLDKYISFGVNGERKPYYSIDGERTLVPESVGWPEFQHSDPNGLNARHIHITLGFKGNTINFTFYAQGGGTDPNRFAEKTWEGSFIVNDLDERIKETVYAQAFCAATVGHLAYLREAKCEYLSSPSSQSFALGYGNKDDETGKTFGITAENAEASSLEFDIKLSDDSLKETLKLSAGYNGEGSIGTYGTFSDGKAIDFPKDATDGWYSISMPATSFTGGESFDISKANLLKFNMNADFDERAGKKIWLKNVKFKRAAKGVCDVKYILYDTATKTQVTAASGLNGKSLSLAAEWDNSKTYAENPMFIATLYDEKGFMEDIKAVSFNAEELKPGSNSAELFSVPSDGKKYSVGVYLIDSFEVSKPYGGGILLK